MKVSAGTTVTWVNHDDIPHTVVSSDKVFAKAGRFRYFCSLHPKMTGEVVVQ